jgi:CRP/FNR family cyclic AMP-dependent transcriptional regulator
VALGKNTKIALLKSVPLFSGCTRAELARLAVKADDLEFGEGKVLAREGRPGHEFFVIVEGTVCVTRKRRRLDDLGPGEWFGEIALLTRGARTATVTATSPVRVLVLTDRAFRQVVETMPSIALKILSSLGKRLEPDNHS